jgi:hypothetical protein
MRSNILTIFPHPNDRQIGAPALPGASSAPRTEALGATVTPVDALPSIESVILQKLLREMEARQVARVQPTYVIEHAPAQRRTSLVRALWCAVWALSMVVCVFVVKYIDNQSMAPTVDAGQTAAIQNLATHIGDQNREFSAMIDSLQGLATAIASNSKRTAVLPAMLSRLGSDLEQIHSPPVRQAIELPPAPGLLAQEGEAAIPMGGHRHAPLESAIVAPLDVVVHHNSAGVMDYWLAPRVVSGVRNFEKVVPISQSAAGTFVHHVSEVKDYIITPAGVWLAASDAENQ